MSVKNDAFDPLSNELNPLSHVVLKTAMEGDTFGHGKDVIERVLGVEAAKVRQVAQEHGPVVAPANAPDNSSPGMGR